MAKIGTHSNCITHWPNLEPILAASPGGQIQVEPHTNGQIWPYLAGEITQVKESIPWVRCASGNVSSQCWKFISDLVESVECRQDLQLVLERGFLEQS